MTDILMLLASKKCGPVSPGVSSGPLDNQPTNRDLVLDVNYGAYAAVKEVSTGQKDSSPTTASTKVVGVFSQAEILTEDTLMLPLNYWQHELGAHSAKRDPAHLDGDRTAGKPEAPTIR